MIPVCSATCYGNPKNDIMTLGLNTRPDFVLFLICDVTDSWVAGWLGSRVVSVLDSGAEGPGFKSQPQCCRVTVLGKLFTPITPSLFTPGLKPSFSANPSLRSLLFRLLHD